MTSGFEVTHTILASCRTHSVQFSPNAPQSQSVLPCRSRSANQTSTGCCVEVTALTRQSIGIRVTRVCPSQEHSSTPHMTTVCCRTTPGKGLTGLALRLLVSPAV